MSSDLRVCRFCSSTSEQVRFYEPDSVAGRAAGLCCQPCWVKKSLAWRRANRNRWNARRHQVVTMRRYGLTESEYVALFAAPVCAGCLTSSDRRLAVDHDHLTGKVRGLLCGQCNLAVGNAGDRPDVLRRLADYIQGALPTRATGGSR